MLVRATICLAFWLFVQNSSAAVLSGKAFALRSTGSASGASWTLNRDGYLGTYIKVAAAGDVIVTVEAQGTPSGGISPHMNVVIADTKAGFDVAGAGGKYGHTFSLPTGTFFVRIEFNNDLGDTPRQLKVGTVSITGATISNTNSNSNALAASDTYIANYRTGWATVIIPGLAPGTKVGVSLKRIAFNFGAAVDYTMNDQLTGTDTGAVSFQATLDQNFNTIVTANEMWKDTEAVRGRPTMSDADNLAAYAAAHHMTARLHNMLWDDQQGPWVNSLKTAAARGDVRAKKDLRNAIRNRISYYFGSSPGESTPHAARFSEVDVYNESYNSGQLGNRSTYWNLFGAGGTAGIYNESLKQATKRGSAMKLFVNDFDVLDDPNYSSGYIRNIEAIRQAALAAGNGEVIGGIGLQYYKRSFAAHQPSTFVADLQNIDVERIPNQLNEFGTLSGVSADDSAKILGEAMRLMFGNADSRGFINWYWVKENGGGNQFAPNGALYEVSTNDWINMQLTPAGKVWQDQLGIADWDGNPNNGWNTQLTATTDAKGAINFDGYYGDYELTVGGQTYRFSFVKGTSIYSVTASGF